MANNDEQTRRVIQSLNRDPGWAYDKALWIWICLMVAVLGLTLGMFGCGMPMKQWPTQYPYGPIGYDQPVVQPFSVTTCSPFGVCVTN